MKVGILGQLRVVASDGPVEISAPIQRALLAFLTIQPGEVVSTDRILEALWGEAQPSGGPKTLRYHVSKLRETIGDASHQVILTERPGYALSTAEVSVDAEEFRVLVGRGRQFAESDPKRCNAELSRALQLWRGRALEEFEYREFARVEIRRLEEERLQALEIRLRTELDLGRHADVIPELVRLVDLHPYREALRGLLITALYRASRQAEALREYQRMRSLLGEELGIEPSPELVALEEKVLLQDPALTSSPPEAPQHNLPADVSSFVGRDEEIRTLRTLMAENRIVALLGPGGSGKTRLALEVGRRATKDFPHGVWFVDLSTLRDPGLVTQRVANALGVREESGRPLLERLTDFIGESRQLVILDNCERLIDATASLAGLLLKSCEQLSVIATSRERLGIAGEVQWHVPPLSLPDSGSLDDIDQVMASDAVQLFVARARETLPSFDPGRKGVETIYAICDRLDRMPLAIELAAVRVRILDLGGILERLADRFAFLSGGPRTVDVRHRTLRATMDWSYELLNGDSRRLLNELSGFRGGATLEAIEFVGAASVTGETEVLDVLTRLIDSSMVVTIEAPSRRYQLLETVREYAASKLAESGQLETVQDRHGQYYAHLATEVATALSGPNQAAALNRLLPEIENFSAAIDRSIESGSAVQAATMAEHLWPFWHMSGNLSRGLRSLQAVVDAPCQPTTERSIHHGIAALGASLGNYELAARHASQALEALGNDEPLAKSKLLTTLGGIQHGQGDPQAAIKSWSMARDSASQARDERQQAFVSSKLAWAFILQGDAAAALATANEALTSAQRVGDPYVITEALMASAEAHLELEDLEPSSTLAHEAIDLADEAGLTNQGSWARYTLGRLAGMTNQPDTLKYLDQALEGFRAFGEKEGIVYVQLARTLGLIASHAVTVAEAALGEASQLAEHGAQHTRPSVLEARAAIDAERNQPYEAKHNLAEADMLRIRLGTTPTAWDRHVRQAIEMHSL